MSPQPTPGQRIQAAFRLGRALRLVWQTAPRWTLVNAALVVVQGGLPLSALNLALLAVPLSFVNPRASRSVNLIFALLVGSLMVPNVVTLVPQYMLVQQLGWLSTYQGLIVPEAATVLAFGVFLLRQFFLGIPTELEDAARIDGANAWQIFSRVILPLSHPAFAALAVFAFRSAWNDFLWPLIAVNKADMFTLPVALAFLRGAYMNESYGPIMAGAVLSALPLLIVFLFANRRIVEGVQLSGLKG
jgi:multiple sugar transport system permease protein